MHKRQVVELSLRSILGLSRGLGSGRTRCHLVVARLVWPRPSIAEKVAFKTVTLDREGLDLSGQPWHAGILFKETVQGPFGLQVSVSEPLTNERAAELFSFLVSSALKIVGREVGSVLGGALVGDLAEVPFKYLSKAVEASRKKLPDMVAAGSIDAGVGDWSAGGDTALRIPLAAPRSVYKTVRSRKAGQAGRRRRLVKEGQENGEAVVTARVYG